MRCVAGSDRISCLLPRPYTRHCDCVRNCPYSVVSDQVRQELIIRARAGKVKYLSLLSRDKVDLHTSHRLLRLNDGYMIEPQVRNKERLVTWMFCVGNRLRLEWIAWKCSGQQIVFRRRDDEVAPAAPICVRDMQAATLIRV